MMKETWCKLIVTVNCGCLEDAISALQTIIEDATGDIDKYIHQNSISLVEIERVE